MTLYLISNNKSVCVIATIGGQKGRAISYYLSKFLQGAEMNYYSIEPQVLLIIIAVLF